jgi:hypothetical protein
VILIPNIVLEVLEGSTIAPTEIYGKDKKTYINIGSGGVFNLTWTVPVLTNEAIDHYNLVIKRYDPALKVYYNILDKNIGLVNKFFVNSYILPAIPEQYMLSIYVVAYGKRGSVITSNVVNPYVSKGTGSYVKIQPTGYKEPIMKRALAFAKVTLTDLVTLKDSLGRTLKDIKNRTLVALRTSDSISTGNAATTGSVSVLTDCDGKILKDAKGRTLFAKASKVLESSSGWALIQEGYVKGADGKWRANDIKYEVLLDQSGTIIIDSNNEPIYIL